MKRNSFIKYLLLAVIGIFAVHYASAAGLDALKLVNKQSVLNDRAWMYLPAAVKNIARTTDIMSADPNGNEETRMIMDTGDMRLVFFAQEIYLKDNGNLFAEMSKKPNDFTFSRKILNDKDSVLTILSTPTQFDTARKGILVNSLLVKMPDHTVFRINAFINKAAYDRLAEFQKLTERVFSTLIKGNRRINRKAHAETLPMIDGRHSFVFQLPEDYCITIDHKYDFEVYKFHKYISLDDTGWVSLMIYTGSYPSYFYKDYNLDLSAAKKIPGRCLDKNVEWYRFQDNKDKMILQEQEVPFDEISKGFVIHIAMLGSTGQGVDELNRIVETARLTGR